MAAPSVTKSEPPTIVPPPSDPLPKVVSGVSAIEATAAIEAVARRGKMAGFQRDTDAQFGADAAFFVTDFGTPFESILIARSKPLGVGCELSFELRMKTTMIWVFALILVFTVWPGVWLTDSMLKTYFTSYTISTWIWYLPLTVPFLPPALWMAIKRARTSARAEAETIIASIATALGGKLVRGTAPEEPRP